MPTEPFPSTVMPDTVANTRLLFDASKMAQWISLSNILEKIIDSEDEVSDFSDIFDEGK